MFIKKSIECSFCNFIFLYSIFFILNLIFLKWYPCIFLLGNCHKPVSPAICWRWNPF